MMTMMTDGDSLQEEEEGEGGPPDAGSRDKAGEEGLDG